MWMDYFGNEKYRVLLNMAQCEIVVGDEKIVKLSQEEIARMVSLSKKKVNSIIGELKKDGYIAQKSPRGQYVITNKATFELAEMGNKEML